LRAALEPLPRAFYARDARLVARALVGARLVHQVAPGDVRVARIVETEAYRGPRDLACHARTGPTKRNRAIFGSPGTAYVFLVYGMHECFNVVCGGPGLGHAVLIRAVEPIAGVQGRTDGPGRVTVAMGISRRHDGASLLHPPLFVAARARRPARIRVTARVGVGYAGPWAEKPWRFFDPTSAHVSKPPRSAIGLG
jgi:DNA-3-methyladenine glycosylase